jgi:hypothetical protein
MQPNGGRHRHASRGLWGLYTLEEGHVVTGGGSCLRPAMCHPASQWWRTGWCHGLSVAQTEPKRKRRRASPRGSGQSAPESRASLGRIYAAWRIPWCNAESRRGPARDRGRDAAHVRSAHAVPIINATQFADGLRGHRRGPRRITAARLRRNGNRVHAAGGRGRECARRCARWSRYRHARTRRNDRGC